MGFTVVVAGGAAEKYSDPATFDVDGAGVLRVLDADRIVAVYSQVGWLRVEEDGITHLRTRDW